MLSENMRELYKRLLVLGLLSVCLIVFSSSDNIESVYAAPCIQDCEASEIMCYDSCATSCSTIDANCNSCLASCQTQFQNCISHAVWCEDGGPSATPNCQTEYANHCPIASGTPNPDCTGGHSGYYQICENIGGQRCVACPGNESCTGSGGLPRCY